MSRVKTPTLYYKNLSSDIKSYPINYENFIHDTKEIYEGVGHNGYRYLIDG